MKGEYVWLWRMIALFSTQLVYGLLGAQSPACLRYNEASGFNASEVYALLQDRNGFIWTATDRGVFRFDGYTFEPFTTAQGLTDNTVFCMQEDDLGRIWLMPFNGRLCYIENNKVVQYTYNDTLEKYLPGMRIARSINLLPSGGMEIGYLAHGIVTVSAYGELQKTTGHIPGAQRQYVAVQTEQEELLLATSNYSIHSRILAFTFQCRSFTVCKTYAATPRRENIKGVKRRSGTWCFAVGNQLIEIDTLGKVNCVLLPREPLCVYEDADECLWMGFDQQGGVRRYTSAGSCSDASFEDFYQGETVTDIIQDTEGAFWISTLYNGLIYIPFVNVRCWGLGENSDDHALAFMPYGTSSVFTLWRDHGVARMVDNQLKCFSNMPGDESVAFKTLAWNAYTDELMIGTTQRTYAYSLEAEKCLRSYRAGANSLVVNERGTYVGSPWSLRFWSHEKLADSMVVIGNPAVRTRPDVLFTDRSRQIWMGGLNGLHRVNDTGLVSCLSMHRLLKNRISGICELADSTLVVATQSNGIVLIRNGTAEEMRCGKEILFDHISGITSGADNTFWISSRSGLYSASVTDSGCSIHLYTGLRDIAGDGGACYYSPETKTLWLANNTDVITFDPSRICTDLPSPPVYIRSVSINDSALSLTQKPELDYNHNFLHVVFSGLVYRLTGDILYRYRLTGADSSWKYTRQHSLDLAGLQPGEYRLELEAQGEDGKWSNFPAVYSFFLRPPFWETRTFRACALMLALLACWGIIAMRYRILRKGDLLREQALVYRQEALASQMNPHFVFNAMNTIQALVLNEDKTKALEMFSSFAKLLRKSLQHSGERYIPLSEEITSLGLYFQLEQMRFGEKLKLSIDVAAELQPDKIAVPAMLVQPMVENAILHGIGHRDTGGTVTVRFLIENEDLICEVEDDGIGRASLPLSGETARKKSGIKITQDRLQVLSELEGSVYIFKITDKICARTGTAKGTLVRFKMPHVSNRRIV